MRQDEEPLTCGRHTADCRICKCGHLYGAHDGGMASACTICVCGNFTPSSPETPTHSQEHPKQMNDLIQRITNAIFRQEGMGLDHQNPGNLRACPWLNGTEYGKITASAGGFWVPTSRAQGIAGAAHVVALHIAEGDSLRKLISIWAPPSENNTEAYIQHVAGWASIPNPDLPLWNYIQEPVS